MSTPLSRTCALALIAVAWLASGVPASAAQEAPASPQEMLRDKTLVVWAAPANLDQRGGSALSIDNGDGSFDAVVFGELEPKRWMPGSNGFVRTEKNQAAWPAETARPDEFVQMAIVYRGREIAVYRNGKEYARYAMAESPQSFSTQAVAVFGRRHLDTRDPERSFAGRIRDARIYARPLDVPTLASLKPGEASAGLEPWAWWSFADEGLREKTGRFNQIKFIGDVRIEKGCLVLPGKGASVFAASAPQPLDARLGWVPIPREWSITGPVPDEVVRSTRLLRERLLADPYRPAYHFCPPEDMGIPGDPNGAFYHNGRYHLMYLYNRNGSGFSWGHVSSTDLVHWRHHPDAIGPGGGDEGCFSGGGFVDDNGTAYLSYWMLWGAKGIGLAQSSDPHFDRWTKLDANPVIRSTEFGLTEVKDRDGKSLFYGSADPSNIWKKQGRYYMLTGNLPLLNKMGRSPDAPPDQQGDRLYLFASDDLKAWKYLHVFYQRNPQWTDRSEDNMCPSFLPLPSSADGGPASGKHLLVFISHNRGCQYYIGDYRDDRFFPQRHGRMSWIDNTFFAPEALVDGQGRQILWAWLTDNPPDEKPKGWSGVFGLPRTLWLGDDGNLCQRPVKELETLRCRPQTWSDRVLHDNKPSMLPVFSGDCCEIQMEIEPAASARCGLKVRASRDGKEETLLYYDAQAKQLVFDATRSGPVGRTVVERAPLTLKPGEPLRLRVYVDKSVVEVYANDRQAIARRVYPARSDSLGVSLFTDGGTATFRKLQAWEITPSNPF